MVDVGLTEHPPGELYQQPFVRNVSLRVVSGNVLATSESWTDGKGRVSLT